MHHCSKRERGHDNRKKELMNLAQKASQERAVLMAKLSPAGKAGLLEDEGFINTGHPFCLHSSLTFQQVGGGGLHLPWRLEVKDHGSRVQKTQV